MNKVIKIDGKEYLEVMKLPHSSGVSKRYELKPWNGRRTDVYGNNRACGCPGLKRVVGLFCVCLGMCWCPKHGGPRCVGGHD